MLMRIKTVVLLLICAVFAAAPAYAIVKDGAELSEYSSSSEVLSSLGIWNGELSDTVTRGEFTELIITALREDRVSAGENVFSDVPETHKYAGTIYAARALGIVSGEGKAKFNPDAEISCNAALKMLCCALGYGDWAELRGGYPAGYTQTAKSIGLTKNVASRGEGAVSREDAAVLIYNFINAPMFEIAQVGAASIGGRKNSDLTVIGEKWGLETLEGVIKSAGYVTMVPDCDIDESTITVGGKNFHCNVDDVEKYLGLDAKIFYDEDTNTVSAVYANPKNKIYTVKAEDIKGYGDFALKYENTNGSSREYKLKKGFTFVKNGRALAQSDEDFLIDDGCLTLIDSDWDGYIDTVLAEVYSYMVVSSRSDMDDELFDIKGGVSLKLKKEDGCWYRLRMLAENGTLSDIVPSQIDVDTVVLFCKSDDGKYIDAIVCGDKISGGIEGIDDEGYVTIDGVRYRKNRYFDASVGANLGISGDFLLAADGTVTGLAATSESRYRYGYVIGKTISDIDEEFYLRLLDENGKILRFRLADRVRIDGEKRDSTDERVKDVLLRQGVVKYQLIRYKTNADNYISAVDTAAELPTKMTPEKKYSGKTRGDDDLYINVKNSKAYLYSYYKTFIPFATVGQNTVIFKVPKCLADSENLTGADKRLEKYDEKNFKVITAAELEEDNYLVDMYNMNNKLQPDVIIVYEGDPDESPVPERSLRALVVEKASKALNADDEITLQLTAWRDGSFKTYTLDTDLYAELTAKGSLPKAGDIIRATIGNPGEITGLSIDVSYDRDTEKPKLVSPGSSQIYDVCYSGTLFSSGDGTIVIKADVLPEWQSAHSDTPKDSLVAFSVLSDTYFARYTPGEGVTEIKAGELRPGLAVGNSGASPVIVYSYRNGVRLLVEYCDD